MSDPRQAPAPLNHLGGIGRFASVRSVQRRYDDSRARRYFDVFGGAGFETMGDINLMYCAPGAITAWHSHAMQWDEWFVVSGQLKVGLALQPSPADLAELVEHPAAEYTRSIARPWDHAFVTLSEWDDVVLDIAPLTLHGWMNEGTTPAILLYRQTLKYDPEHPDEQRFTLAQVGADWTREAK